MDRTREPPAVVHPPDAAAACDRTRAEVERVRRQRCRPHERRAAMEERCELGSPIA